MVSVHLSPSPHFMAGARAQSLQQLGLHWMHAYTARDGLVLFCPGLSLGPEAQPGDGDLDLRIQRSGSERYSAALAPLAWQLGCTSAQLPDEKCKPMMGEGQAAAEAAALLALGAAPSL